MSKFTRREVMSGIGSATVVGAIGAGSMTSASASEPVTSSKSSGPEERRLSQGATLISMHKLFLSLADTSGAHNTTLEQLAVMNDRDEIVSWAMEDGRMSQQHAEIFADQAPVIVEGARKMRAGLASDSDVNLWVDGWAMSIFVCRPNWEPRFSKQEFPRVIDLVSKDVSGLEKKVSYVNWNPVEMNIGPMAILAAVRAARLQLWDMAQRGGVHSDLAQQLKARADMLV